ncbi:LuxR C-terminal-related transcriptional regulator [Shewanella sp. Isolate8]|uniref:helix-turn-helix transcriptional regulator n=1 Tax=Shewanella sp. Isolate8 TaxID=2908529 RepID=UPI001EFCE07E|nr:LuxR C-terminal-related transcriptional regulator [Shewanella sp. Isolate8]MCG9747734.1 LuxR C-terminal-related transcriptional regulator [Shewanella sp. Isolate8]
MYNGEIFTLSQSPKNIQLLKHVSGLLNLKVNTSANSLTAWHTPQQIPKILFHFLNDVHGELGQIDSGLLSAGKHIAICESLSMEDELTLIKHGFSGATKACSPAHAIVQMLDNVLEGNLFFSLSALSHYIQTQQQPAKASERHALFQGITKKEKEVLSFICKGLSNSEAANKMNVSINTIKMHLQNIYKKTDCKSRGQLLVKYNQI